VKWFIKVLSSLVRRVPVVVLVASVVATAVFGFFSTQAEQATGNEGFSPDSDEYLALLTIDEVFSDNSEVAVQVVFDGGVDDVITGDGVRAYLLAREAIIESRATELLVGRPDGDIVGFLDPTLQALGEQGIDPMSATDEQVKGAFTASLEQLPPEVAELFTGLISTRGDLDAASAPAGLMVVFLNLSVLEDDPDQIELQAIEVDMADHIREATEGSTVTAEPFSFALLFADQGEFEREIGRLFGTAFAIIMTILLLVFSKRVSRSSRVRGSVIGAGVAFLITLGLQLAGIAGFEDVWDNAGEAIGILVGAGVVGAVLGYAFSSGRRALADMAMTMGVIVMSIFWMNGIGVLLGPDYLGIIGPFNELLQIIPILLIGLGVDYAIHLTARYREEVAGGVTVIDAAVKASRTVGVALVLATVTTSVGFLTNIFSPVTAIADFGVLATVGIGSAFILMLTFVPSTRILLDRRAEAAGTLPVQTMEDGGERLLSRIMGSTSVLARKVPAVMVTIAFVLGGLGAWGWSNLSTKFSFTDFVPEGSALLVTFETITEEFGGGFGERTQVLIEGDVATPEAHNALVEASANMADTEFVVTFAGRAQAESPLSVIASLVTPPAEGAPDSGYDAGFAEAAAALGLQPDLTVSGDADVAALYDLAAAAAPDAMRRVAAREGAEYRYVDVSVATQAGEQGAAPLRDALGEDFAPLDAVDGVSAVATNENIVSRGVVEALQSSQLSSLFLTLGAASLLLVLNFLIESRRPALGLLTMLPVALVVLWVFGMMAASGISFNPVTAMIASIAIGIGVPYTIHITHRFQEDRLRCDSPEEAIRNTMTHTGGALLGSAFTTVAGFGILATSTLKPFQQFGQVVAYAIGFAMLGAVLVLPSMLVMWDRWHRRRGHAALDERAVRDAMQLGAE